MPRSKAERAKSRMVHILIPEKLHVRVRVRCAYEDRSIQNYVEMLITRDMKAYKLPGEGKRRK